MASLKARSESGDSSSKNGFRAFLERVSSRFRRVKPDAAAANGKPVSISVTPAEPPSSLVNGLVIESLETTTKSPTALVAGGGGDDGLNDDVSNSVFTLGFSAAANDLSSYAVAPLLGSLTRNGSSTSAPSNRLGAMPRGATRAHAHDSVAATKQPSQSVSSRRNHSRATSSGGAAAALTKPAAADVRSALRRIGQGRHADLFEREEIDLRAFRELTEVDLCELGIAERSDRQAIMGCIKIL